MKKQRINWDKIRQLRGPDPGREIALFTPLEGLIQAYKDMPPRRSAILRAFKWALKNNHFRDLEKQRWDE
jgi:hypothetical protein